MILEVKALEKSFNDKKVLDGIDFTILPGKITSIAGRNGSGKTTILKIISGILDADKGSVMIDSQDLKKFPALREKVAFLPDLFNFFIYERVKNVVEYYKIIYPRFDEKFFNRKLEEAKLSLDDRLINYSKGNKALLGLIMIISTGADFIIVDEILDGMDVLNRNRIIQLLIDAADRGKGILLSSHELSELEGISDSIIYLSLDGKISIMQEAGQAGMVKMQIVAKDELPSELLEKLTVRQHIGRVYTCIGQGSKETWEENLKADGVVQYDFLNIKLEDLFYFEKDKEEKDERLNENV